MLQKVVTTRMEGIMKRGRPWKRWSHLKQNSLTSTIPWLTPTHTVSPSHTCPWPPCGSLPSTTCFCTRTLHYPPSCWLRLFFETNLFPNKYSNILKPSHPSYLSAYEDGTECSETSACKIQTQGNYPEESVQHSEHGESLKLRISKAIIQVFSEQRNKYSA